MMAWQQHQPQRRLRLQRDARFAAPAPATPAAPPPMPALMVVNQSHIDISSSCKRQNFAGLTQDLYNGKVKKGRECDSRHRPTLHIKGQE